MNESRERGSVLILVLIAALVLTLIGLSALTQSSTEAGTARNFMLDKTAFYAADAGLQWGIKEMREGFDPTTIQFEETFGDYTYYTGTLEDSGMTTTRAFLGFKPPPPTGVSIEESGEMSAALRPYRMVVSSRPNAGFIGAGARKQVQTVIIAMSAEY